MNLREAAQQALEALESFAYHGKAERWWDATNGLRAALAEDAMQRLTDEQQMIERGTKAWADVPDATAWVQEIRGNVPAPTSQESRQIEPVAYVTGYSKGYATVQPIDPCLLMPVGMALYRSPPANQNYLNGYCVGRTDLLAEQAKTETVEPVAYRLSETDIYDFAGWLTTRPGVLEIGTSKEAGPMAEAVGEYIRMFSERFAAPPKRKPLTDEEIQECVAEVDDARLAGPITELIRAAERKLGIGGEK